MREGRRVLGWERDGRKGGDTMVSSCFRVTWERDFQLGLSLGIGGSYWLRVEVFVLVFMDLKFKGQLSDRTSGGRVKVLPRLSNETTLRVKGVSQMTVLCLQRLQ